MICTRKSICEFVNGMNLPKHWDDEVRWPEHNFLN